VATSNCLSLFRRLGGDMQSKICLKNKNSIYDIFINIENTVEITQLDEDANAMEEIDDSYGIMGNNFEKKDPYVKSKKIDIQN
jgi:hypothetical protein